MLKILVLICPVALDHAACQPDNALDVIRGGNVPSGQQCGFLGQAVLARTALVPDPARQYAKVVCLRDGP